MKFGASVQGCSDSVEQGTKEFLFSKATKWTLTDLLTHLCVKGHQIQSITPTTKWMLKDVSSIVGFSQDIRIHGCIQKHFNTGIKEGKTELNNHLFGRAPPQKMLLRF